MSDLPQWAESPDATLEIALPAATGITTVDNGYVQHAFDKAGQVNGYVIVRGQPGSIYSLSQTVTPPGGDIGVDFSADQPAGTNKPMLLNAAALPVLAATDGAMTANTNIVQTSIAHLCTVGQMIAVAPGEEGGGNGDAFGTGPGPAGYVYYGTITQIIDATHVQVLAAHLGNPSNPLPAPNFLPAFAQNTGGPWSVWVFNRDKNIRFIGGTWTRHNSDGTAATGFQSCYAAHGIVMRRVDVFHIAPDPTFDGRDAVTGKFMLSLTDLDKWVIDNPTVYSYSDGCHMGGPLREGKTLGLRGYTLNDDFHPVLAGDWPVNGDVTGDIIGCVFNNVLPEKCGGAIFHMTGGPGCWIDDVSGRSHKGQGLQFTSWVLGDGSKVTLQGSNYGTVTFDDIGALPVAQGAPQSAPKGLSLNPTHFQKIHIGISRNVQVDVQTPCIAWNPKADNPDGTLEIDAGLLQLAPGATAPMLLTMNSQSFETGEINVMRLNVPSAVGLNRGVVFMDLGAYTAVVDRLRFKDCNMNFADQLSSVVLIKSNPPGGTQMTGGFRKIFFDGGHYKGGANLFRNALGDTSHTVPAEVFLTNGVHVEAMAELISNIGGTVNIHHDGTAILDGLTGAHASVADVTAKTLIRGTQPVLTNMDGIPPFIYSGGGVAANTRLYWTGQRGRSPGAPITGEYLTPNGLLPNALSGPTAARLYLVRFSPSVVRRFKKLVAATGNSATADTGFDIGIYDSTLSTLLGHYGVGTANQLLAPAGVKPSKTLNTPVKCLPSETYYAALQVLTFTGGLTFVTYSLGSGPAASLFSTLLPDCEFMFLDGVVTGTSLPDPGGVPLGVPTATSFGPVLVGLET